MGHKLQFEDLILFQDDDYIVVSKPPYLSTLEDRQDNTNLLSLAKGYSSNAQVCHRLDKETSGALAIAKHPEAYRHLSIQFEKREVVKIYHAVVDGIHNYTDELVDAGILKQDDGVVRINKREGKQAQTYFTSLAPYRFHTLMECRPVTGRMHQIRIHLTILGAPIVGDDTYGGKPFYLSQVKRVFNLKKDTVEEPFIKRMALHAYSLEFDNMQGKRIKIEAPYQKDMQALVRQLELNR
ncbi:MAG TPA: pseudouridine synthase [Chryseolinea sp.]|nr:pseudouridine synthase [Chryseolinea sp.]